MTFGFFNQLYGAFYLETYQITNQATHWDLVESPEQNNIFSMEKKKLHIEIRDENATYNAWAEITVYTEEYPAEYLGTYIVCEGSPLLLEVDDRPWDVRIESCSVDCEVYWFIE